MIDNDRPDGQFSVDIQQNPAAFMNDVRKESRVVWKGVAAFIQREHVEGRPRSGEFTQITSWLAFTC
jgi:hypothetical protein